MTLVDAKECELPLLDRMYKEYPKGEAPEVLERLAALYRAADAFVVVSGEYNHGIPPALKNLLDHFLEEYFFRPSAIVCYSAGAFGGVRAAMQLRMTLAELASRASPPCSRPQGQERLRRGGPAHDPAWEKRVGASSTSWNGMRTPCEQPAPPGRPISPGDAGKPFRVP